MKPFFEALITYTKREDEQKKAKKVSERYLVKAETYTEAEAKMYKVIEGLSHSEDRQIVDIKRSNIDEVWLRDEENVKFFKVKLMVQFDLDEKSKPQAIQVLAQAKDINSVPYSIFESTKEWIINYSIDSIVESKIYESC